MPVEFDQGRFQVKQIHSVADFLRPFTKVHHVASNIFDVDKLENSLVLLTPVTDWSKKKEVNSVYVSYKKLIRTIILYFYDSFFSWNKVKDNVSKR